MQQLYGVDSVTLKQSTRIIKNRECFAKTKAILRIKLFSKTWTTNDSMTFLEVFFCEKSIVVIKHQPYSPDFAICNIWTKNNCKAECSDLRKFNQQFTILSKPFRKEIGKEFLNSREK